MLCLESVNVCLFLSPIQALKWVCFDFAVVTLNSYFIHFCIAYVQLCNPILSPMNADSGRYVFAPYIWSFHFYIPHERPRPGGLIYYWTIVFSAITFYCIPGPFDDSKGYWIEQYRFIHRHTIYDSAWVDISSPSLLLPNTSIKLKHLYTRFGDVKHYAEQWYIIWFGSIWFQHLYRYQYSYTKL